MDHSGALRIQPQFNDADGFSCGLAAVALGNRYGYINLDGQLIIPPQFDWAWKFVDGLALTLSPPFYQYVDPHGKTVLKGEFEKAWNASEGLMVVLTHGKHFACFNQQGHCCFAKELDHIGPFRDGMASACWRGRWGFLNTDGQWAIEPVYDAVGPFSEGRAPAKKQRQTGYLTYSGEWAFQLPFEDAGPFKDGIAMTQMRNSLKLKEYIAINNQGKVLFKAILDDAGDFSEGLAWVRLGDKFGFINTQGNIVIAPRFDFVQNFEHNLAHVADWPHGWFYINRFGHLIQTERKAAG